MDFWKRSSLSIVRWPSVKFSVSRASRAERPDEIHLHCAFVVRTSFLSNSSFFDAKFALCKRGSARFWLGDSANGPLPAFANTKSGEELCRIGSSPTYAGRLLACYTEAKFTQGAADKNVANQVATHHCFQNYPGSSRCPFHSRPLTKYRSFHDHPSCPWNGDHESQ